MYLGEYKHECVLENMSECVCACMCECVSERERERERERETHTHTTKKEGECVCQLACLFEWECFSNKRAQMRK